jgi:6-phospho-beta-glucosidase
MQDNLVICIVGAGSSYTPELIEGIINQPAGRLPVAALRLFDPDVGRLGVMAGLAERMFRAAGRAVEVRSGARLEPLLAGADFVITQIRVGSMAARHLDESIPLRYGLIGQETTGPGGLFKALRTIPPMLAIARTVAAAAPQAWILNYTNPSGIITEAVTRHTSAKFIGLCSGIPDIQQTLKQRFAGEYPDLRSYCVGLNHLGFIHRITAGGRDVTSAVLAALAEDEKRGMPGSPGALPWSFCRELGAIPIAYLNYYFHRGREVEHLRRLEKSRARQVMEIEQAVLAQAADPAVAAKPEALKQRGGGGYAGITFAVMTAMAHDTGEELVASVKNGDAVEGLPAEAVVEVVCRVDRRGATPLKVGPIPSAFRGLVQAVKAYELLAVQAAVERSRLRVKQALMNHPLAGDLDVIEPLVDELLKAHGLDFT